MTMMPDKKGDAPYPGNDRDSFQKHNEWMKGFCLSHPRVEKVPKSAKSRGLHYLVPFTLIELPRYAWN